MSAQFMFDSIKIQSLYAGNSAKIPTIADSLNGEITDYELLAAGVDEEFLRDINASASSHLEAQALKVNNMAVRYMFRHAPTGGVAYNIVTRAYDAKSGHTRYSSKVIIILPDGKRIARGQAIVKLHEDTDSTWKPGMTLRVGAIKARNFKAYTTAEHNSFQRAMEFANHKDNCGWGVSMKDVQAVLYPAQAKAASFEGIISES